MWQANPFELNLEALEREEPMDAILMSGALASFLRDIYVSGAPFAPLLEEDLLAVMKVRFLEMVGRNPPLPPRV